MRPVATLLALASLCTLQAADDGPTALGGSDVQLLDERAWVEAVSRRKQDVASAPAPVEVVLAEDIRTSPAATIPDRLRYLPGVDVYQLRHGQYEVGLRGYNGPMNSRILVVQDGWQFAQPDLSTPMWSGSIFMSDLERIEIAKGPASVTYGANAFGGVIAMTSREVGDAPRLDVVASSGWPHALDGDATASTPLGHGWYTKLSAGYTRLEDLPGVESGLAYQPSDRTSEDTKLDTVAWRAHGLLGVRLGDGWRLEAGSRILHRDPWEVIDGSSQGASTIANDDRLATLELRSELLRLSVFEQHIRSTYTNQQAVYDPTFDYSYPQFGFTDVKRAARAQVDLGQERNHVTLGGEGSIYTTRSNLWLYGSSYTDEATWGEEQLTNVAAFAEDQCRLGEGWLLTAGVRDDHDSQVGNQVSPRLAVNWTPDRHQFALLSLSRGYRLPNILERYEHDYFAKPSEDLQAETIQSVESQWRLRDGKGSELSLGGFWNRSNQQMWRTPLPKDEQLANFTNWFINGMSPITGPGPFFQYANLDNPYTVYGAEIAGRTRFTDLGLTAWSNATWQLGRYRDPVHFSSSGFSSPLGTLYQFDYTVPRDANAPPEWKANAGVEWSSGGWFASAAGRYVSGRTVYDNGATRLLTNTFIAIQTLDPYVALDLGVGYRLPGAKTRYVRLSVLDLFDSQHSEWFRNNVGTLTNANESQYTSDIGRQITLMAGLEF